MRPIRFVFRLLSIISLALAVILAVGDLARSITASQLRLTPLGESFANAAPETLEHSREWVIATLGASVWHGVGVPLLSVPGLLVFALLAVLFYALSRKPRPKYGRIVWPA